MSIGSTANREKYSLTQYLLVVRIILSFFEIRR